MAFGVFIHRADSIYDDSPSERYQFPGQYLSRAVQCIGDWILYYEPRKVPGSKGYYAVARLAGIVPDPAVPGMHLALIEPGSYLEFSAPVPFQLEDGIAETGLLNPEGRISGRAQAAVRTLSPLDFRRIVELGLRGSEVMPRLDEAAVLPVTGLAEQPQAGFAFEVERDRVFRRVVLNAYGERCAVTGLKLINGGGRAEVEAAHIRPVEHKGPDIVNNGIALSGTVHWMFDRGLLGLTDELEILISRQVNDVDGIKVLINPSRRLIGPLQQRDRPHPAFLGGGRAEVEAAHIRPVEHKGPDIVNNGIALSGTVHWMFDRGLLGLTDELEILISRQVNDVDGIKVLINPSRRLIGPLQQRDRPHPAFLAWHREHCFKH